jgi:hypothetical protein
MNRLLFELVFLTPTAVWGWLSFALLVAVIALPYFRRTAISEAGGATAESPRRYWKGLWPHYWLGAAVAAGSLIHGWIPMAAGKMPQTDMNGLWLATYALGLMFLQVLLGLTLRFAGAGRFLKRMHFVVMFGIVALVLAHLWLNGPRL